MCHFTIAINLIRNNPNKRENTYKRENADETLIINEVKF